jgi:HK97 family phage prohead protease
MDSDNDIIRKGAFTKSIAERGVNSISNRKIAFLRHHDWQQPIGKWLTLQEDDYGLFAVGQMGNSTIANDAWEDYKMEIIREHSIGFQYVQDKIKFVEDLSVNGGGYYEVTEVKLFEGSAVTFGSNEYTQVVQVKSAEDKNAKLLEITKHIDNVIKSLTTGEYSDDRGYALEMRLKWLQNKFMLLSTAEPFAKEYSEKGKPMENFDWAQVVNQFTNK